MRNYFTFDGLRSIDYGVLISGEATYNAPARDMTPITVPGRDGILTMDNGRFFPIEHTYPAFIIDGFDANIKAFRNAMMARRGSLRLTDTYHSDEFYLAYYEAGLEAEVTRLKSAGSFDLTFTRDPRRFLTSGETVKICTGRNNFITNPTLFPSKPLIRAYGTGYFYIGDEVVTISAANEYTDIDCEIQEAYKGTVSCNQNVEFSGQDFPTLPPGATNISCFGSITSVEITPRWFIL